MHAKSLIQPKRQSERLSGLSLLEVLAIVTILGIVALAAIPRLNTFTAESDKTACYVNRGDIEVQAQLHFRNEGAWPQADLSDIGSDGNYFPDGLPVCPVDGSPYTLDPSTHRVVGHDHG